MSGGPYAQTTGHDDLPLDGFGGAAGAGGDAADNSADTNVHGANDVAGNANAEAQEIAAVPDPTSPQGMATILAIIEKYQSKSTATVEGSAASEQANGAQAAGDSNTHHHNNDDNNDDDTRDSAGSSGLMDILSQLLGSGGSGLGAMSPFGEGGSPFGSGMGGFGGGASPFGDPYSAAQTAGASAPAANPFADPLPTSPATTTSSSTPGDPFASTPAAAGSATPAANQSDAADPAAAGAPAAAVPRGKGGAGASEQGGMDLQDFSSGDGSGVPADPSTTTN
jgi:cell division septation protein DedD